MIIHSIIRVEPAARAETAGWAALAVMALAEVMAVQVSVIPVLAGSGGVETVVMGEPVARAATEVMGVPAAPREKVVI